MPRKTAEQPRHGGRRAGAGAPAGNLNAVKTGAGSAIIQEGIEALMSDPLTGHLFSALIMIVTNRHQRAQHHMLEAMLAAGHDYQHPTPSRRTARARV